MKPTNLLALGAIMTTSIFAGCGSHSEKLSYPAAPQDGTVDTVFGMEVIDTYRPLENDTSAETARWVEAENALTQEYLSKIPYRDRIRERLTGLSDYVKRGLPWRGEDGRWYFFENDGLRNQCRGH